MIWIPFIAFIIQFGANTAMLLKAIRSEAEPAPTNIHGSSILDIDVTPSPAL